MPATKATPQPKKVAVKKAVAKKKATPKKKVTSAKKSAARVLRKPEEFFWVVNGGGLKSLAELSRAIETMSEEQFAFHTVRDGNDFARWITGVFSDETLARKVAKQKTREQHLVIIREYLGE